MAAERAEADIKELKGRIENVEVQVTKINTDMGEQMKNLDEQKKNLMDDLNLEFANIKIALNEVVMSAKGEFDVQRSYI